MPSDIAMGGPMGGLSSGPNMDRSSERKNYLEPGEELSYYALEIESIADLIQQQNLFEY